MKICPKTVHLPWPLTIPVYHIISYTLLQIFHQIWSSNVCNFALFIILSTYTNITSVGLRVQLWVTLMILPSRRLQYSLIRGDVRRIFEIDFYGNPLKSCQWSHNWLKPRFFFHRNEIFRCLPPNLLF